MIELISFGKSLNFYGKDSYQKALQTHSFFKSVRHIHEKNYSYFPKTIDINIIGRCNLDCAWCWGPEHDHKEPVKYDEWKKFLQNMKDLGTDSVIFSGGEPLLKGFLPDLLKYAHEDLKLRTTLSTNATFPSTEQFMKRAGKALPYVDDLGVPLDGHTHEINKIMRIGTLPHFDLVLKALIYIQEYYPNIDLTLRTVVTRKNYDSVPFIGKTLLEKGIDPQKLRWKLYQVNPIGPRKKNIKGGQWLLSNDEFERIVSETCEQNPEFTIVSQAIKKSVGRYFIIFPDGKAHIIKCGDSTSEHEDVIMGNVIQNFEEVVNNLKSDFYLLNNSSHGENLSKKLH